MVTWSLIILRDRSNTNTKDNKNNKQKTDLIVCREKPSRSRRGRGSEADGLPLDVARGWVGGIATSQIYWFC